MNRLMPPVTTGISTPPAGEARPLRGVTSVRHSRQPFSGDLTGGLRETPVATVGRVGVGGDVRRSEIRGDSRAAAISLSFRFRRQGHSPCLREP
jgi:hypothetical protein